MSSDWADFLSRDDLLGGLPARRASTLLFAIESRTAHHVARARRAMATYHTERSAAQQERAFIDAIAAGRDGAVQTTVQDLERYAPLWADLVPADPGVRAALARMLGAKYPLPERRVPALGRALGLDDPAVAEAFARLHHQPLGSVYAPAVSWRERLGWARSGVAARLENLPPFWTAFALTLTETVGAGILALPIALANVGPLAGLVVIVVLGLINVLTIAAVAEAVARNGGMRHGQAFFGRLVRDYLGRPGLWILTPSLVLLTVVILLTYYIGLATTLADATGVPAEIWAGIVFLAGLLMLRRESLDATVAFALVVGAASIGLILLLAALALPHAGGANLRHATIPFVRGEPFDASLLELVFGVVLLAYFGHTSTGNCAAVVLRRDPTARAFIRGASAGIVAAMALYGVWVLAVNGAVPAEVLAAESGTALVPLAATAGPGVRVVGSVFAILAMGMASVHYSLALSNMAREWLPVPGAGPGPAAGGRWRPVLDHPRGRFALGLAPVVAVVLGVEALLLTGRASFVAPMGFLGTITASLIGGVFPVLMVVASRRKGDLALGPVWRLVGHPVVVTAVAALFLAGIALHGLVLWEAAYQRIAALLAVAATLAMIVVARRQGAFRRRAVVEVRVEADGDSPAVVGVVASGEPVAAVVVWPEPSPNPGFRSVEIALPPLPVDELRVWVHAIGPDGRSGEMPTRIEVEDAGDGRRVDLRPHGGDVVVSASGAPVCVRVHAVEQGSAPREHQVTPGPTWR